MLEFDYSRQLQSLIQSLDWRIQLPPAWSGFFDEVGECIAWPNDERQNRRMKVRSQGVLFYECPLPSVPRTQAPQGIYSRDFSRRGCSFLLAHELYPHERVRLLLPTFWMHVLVCRSRRVGPSCYEIGAELVEQNLPSPCAFEVSAVEPAPLSTAACS